MATHGEVRISMDKIEKPSTEIEEDSQVMATGNILSQIDNSEGLISKQVGPHNISQAKGKTKQSCTMSHTSLSSDSIAQTQRQVVAGEFSNKIRKKSLEEDLLQHCEMSFDANKWSIYKVPYPLREVNKKAYEPYIISIGPYHHGKEHLKTMEAIKRDCFKSITKGIKKEVHQFVKAMKEKENRVRECYEQPVDGMDSDQFVEMMILDGCFIVLLFQGDSDLIENVKKMKKGTLGEIYNDLLLLENQLPFFVLSILAGMISKISKLKGVKPDDPLPRLVLQHYSGGVLLGQEPRLEMPKSKDIKHLLGLVYSRWVPSGSGKKEKPKETKAQGRWWKFLGCGRKQKDNGIEVKDQHPLKFIRCATELKEAGINFVNKGEELKEKIGQEKQDNKGKDMIGDEEQDKKGKDKIEEEQDKKGKANLFNIDFTTDGKLKIPALMVEDDTERLLRNFMAYEQFLKIKPAYVCDYVKLMDNLINSVKDVQLLCKRGIIDNWLGDDEVVAHMFNKLTDFIAYDSDDFYYADIFDKVNKHYREKWKKRMAKLKKEYCNSPWSCISVIAAVVLLLLTTVQTIFSVVSYVHPK